MPRRVRVLVEASREYDADWLEAFAKQKRRSGRGTSLIVWERVTHRLLSDGTLVERREMKFPPEPGDPEGRYQVYRWLVTGRLRHGVTAEDYARAYREPGKDGSPSPWTVTEWDEGRTQED